MLSQTEKEQTAMQWLRTNFEVLVGSPSTEQSLLYKQYTAACSRNPLRQVLAAVQFYSCVRSVNAHAFFSFFFFFIFFFFAFFTCQETNFLPTLAESVHLDKV